MTILGCLVDSVVPCLTFVGRLVLGSGIAGGRLCKGGNDRFPRIKIFLGYAGAGGGRGAFMQGGKQSISKKNTFASAMGCEGSFMQGGKRSIFKKKKKLGDGGS